MEPIFERTTIYWDGKLMQILDGSEKKRALTDSPFREWWVQTLIRCPEFKREY
jgi:hypothetical protein